MIRLLTRGAVGQRVFVYRNLREKCWSVLGGKPHRLLGHAGSLALVGAWFSVGVGGRDRVRREGRKNVHAGANGQLVSLGPLELPGDIDLEEMKVTYNPVLDDFFVWANGTNLPRKGETDSLVVVMNREQCYAFSAWAA